MFLESYGGDGCDCDDERMMALMLFVAIAMRMKIDFAMKILLLLLLLVLLSMIIKTLMIVKFVVISMMIESFRVFSCCRFRVTGSSRVECATAVFHFILYLHVFLNRFFFLPQDLETHMDHLHQTTP